MALQEYQNEINQLIENSLSQVKDETHTQKTNAIIPYVQSTTAATGLLARLRRLKIIESAMLLCMPLDVPATWQVIIIRNLDGMESKTIVAGNDLAFAICAAFLQSIGVEMPIFPYSEKEEQEGEQQVEQNEEGTAEAEQPQEGEEKTESPEETDKAPEEEVSNKVEQ